MGLLPINLDDLIHARAVETERREFSVASEIQADPKALHEFAQTKMRLAARAAQGRYRDRSRVLRQSLNRQAEELLRRVISLAATDRVRSGWAWYNLAETLRHLGAPADEILQAAYKAQEALPDERIISEFIARMKQSVERRSGRDSGGRK
jgi:ATP-dependent DNA helicase RecG